MITAPSCLLAWEKNTEIVGICKHFYGINSFITTVWQEIFAGQNFHSFRGFASDREIFNRENFTNNANHTLFLRSFLRV